MTLRGWPRRGEKVSPATEAALLTRCRSGEATSSARSTSNQNVLASRHPADSVMPPWPAPPARRRPGENGRILPDGLQRRNDLICRLVAGVHLDGRGLGKDTAQFQNELGAFVGRVDA